MSKISITQNKTLNNINKSVKQMNTRRDRDTAYTTKQILIYLIFLIVIILIFNKAYKYYTHNTHNINEGINKKQLDSIPIMKRPFLNLYAVKHLKMLPRWPQAGAKIILWAKFGYHFKKVVAQEMEFSHEHAFFYSEWTTFLKNAGFSVNKIRPKYFSYKKLIERVYGTKKPHSMLGKLRYNYYKFMGSSSLNTANPMLKVIQKLEDAYFANVPFNAICKKGK